MTTVCPTKSEAPHTTSTYDAFDRTKTATISGTTACGGDARTVTYSYDGLDRQRTSAVSGSSDMPGDPNQTTASIYDGLTTTLVGQTDAATGNNSAPNVHYQLGADGQVMGLRQTVTGPARSVLDTDGHGNVTAQIRVNGATMCTALYDPFGTPVNASTASNTNGVWGLARWRAVCRCR